MTKTTNKTRGSSETAEAAETIEFPAFDAAKAIEQFRSLTEKGIEQATEAYDKMKTTAEEAQKVLEDTFESAKSAGNELALKSIEATRANAEAYFAHIESLVGVKSLSEAIEMQTAFARKQIETAIDQAKGFQAISAKAAGDVSKPMKEAFEKSLKELAVA